MARGSIVDGLLASDEPSIRWQVRAGVLNEVPSSRAMRKLQDEIRTSSRVRTLLKDRNADGARRRSQGIYAKWRGAHWILAHLAEIGYPAGDESLEPVARQVVDHWLSETFYNEFDADTAAARRRRDGVMRVEGRFRRCGSQQGNALLALSRLGLLKNRAKALAERLVHWQWPDGGWNCDRTPSADTSSFMETLLPMRGLAAHAARTGDQTARAAARRAADVFLSRRLFKRRADGTVIRPEFVKLHYPLYWHYDILGGLVAMAELGMIDDPRCQDALDLLERKRLPDSGWPAEARYYTVSTKAASNADIIDWGPTSNRRMNEWVTVRALMVLTAARRKID